MGQSYYFSMTILVIATFGVGVNVACIVILVMRKGASQMFHHLLKILAIYDLVVVVGCALLYALPQLKFPLYSRQIFPAILPWLLPLIQIAMMSSVYCTIVMSFERYIRICHLCQLRDCSYITKTNFKFYVLAIVVIPVMFYIPKFFELRQREVLKKYELPVNCTGYIQMQHLFHGHSQTASIQSIASLKGEKVDDGFQQTIARTMLATAKSNGKLPFPRECPLFNFSRPNDTYVRTVTRRVRQLAIVPTKLRSNRLYHKIYFIGLNTFFGSLLPMFSLLFLNVSTVIALRKMSRQQETVALINNNQRTSSFVDRSKRRIKGIISDRRRENSLSIVSGRFSIPFHPNGRASGGGRFRNHHPDYSVAEMSTINRYNDGPMTIEEDSSPPVPMNQFKPYNRQKSRSAQELTQFLRRGSYSEVKHGEVSGSVDDSRLHDCTHGSDSPPTPAEATTPPTNHTMLSVPEHTFIMAEGETEIADNHNTATALAAQPNNSSVYTSSCTMTDDMRSRENRLTRISLCIVWLFIFCHVWKLVPTLYEGIYSDNEDNKSGTKWPHWLTTVNDISHTLIVFNSAVNFLIYVTL